MFFCFQKDDSEKCEEQPPKTSDCLPFHEVDKEDGSVNGNAKSIAGGAGLLDDSADEGSKTKLPARREKTEQVTASVSTASTSSDVLLCTSNELPTKPVTAQKQDPTPTYQDQLALLRSSDENLDFSSEPAQENAALALPTSTAGESNPLDPCAEFPSLSVTRMPTQELSVQVLPSSKDRPSSLQVNDHDAVAIAESNVDADVDADPQPSFYTTPLQVTDHHQPVFYRGSQVSACQQHLILCHPVKIIQRESHVLVCGNQTELPPDRLSSLSALRTASGTFLHVLIGDDTSTANADSTEFDDGNDSDNSSFDKNTTSQYANAEENEAHLDDGLGTASVAFSESLDNFEDQTDSSKEALSEETQSEETLSEEALSEEEVADFRVPFARRRSRKKHRNRKRS